MLSEKENTQISKFLSLVLRHQPQHIGIVLDEQGWTDVNMLIEKVQKNGLNLTPKVLTYIVDTNAKKRFAFNNDRSKIRASQGHSVKVDLHYAPQVPPAILYHGTGIQSVNNILAQGLLKMKRHHVHLSADIETAIKVGRRHGKPVVLQIDALAMADLGYAFFLSDNGVWLTEQVPARYIRLANTEKEE
jgi:putative RNA 2'-phosphotransferase